MSQTDQSPQPRERKPLNLHLDQIRQFLDARKVIRPMRPRTIEQRKGMDAVADIVTRQALDIVHQPNLEDYTYADEWARKRGYTAYQEDYDKDGIEDVFIRDKHGNLISINGYTTRKSDLPARIVYNTIYPVSVRKEMRAAGESIPTKGQLMSDIYGRKFKDDNPFEVDETQLGYSNPDIITNPTFKDALIRLKDVEAHNIDSDGKQRFRMPYNAKTIKRERSAYAVWTACIFDVIWNSFKEVWLEINTGATEKDFNKLFPVSSRSKLCSILFKNAIVFDTLSEDLEVKPDQMELLRDSANADMLKEVMRKSEVKKATSARVLDLYQALRAHNVNAIGHIFNQLFNDRGFVTAIEGKTEQFAQKFVEKLAEKMENDFLE